MALLQISEPGQSPNPHERRVAIGIDLGTTHSLVAAVRNGIAECLPDEQGRVVLPSVVRYTQEGQRLIGYAATEHGDHDGAIVIDHRSSVAFGGGGFGDLDIHVLARYIGVVRPDKA